MEDDIKSKRVTLQNDELYRRLKTSENQNQNLISLIKELENKIIAQESELTETASMVQKETNLRVEVEHELRLLREKLSMLEEQRHASESRFESEQRYEITELTAKLEGQLRELQSLNDRVLEKDNRLREAELLIEELRSGLRQREFEHESWKIKIKDLDEDLAYQTERNKTLLDQNRKL